MNVGAYYHSITKELEALKERVRQFIAGSHWVTDGEWKESVLRTMIASRLPSSARVGRGFIMTENGPSTQCDIIVYRADSPVLFQDGDLVFLTADAVLAIIEVKSQVTKSAVSHAFEKLAVIGHMMGTRINPCQLCLFSYGGDFHDYEWIVEAAARVGTTQTRVISLVNLGCSIFAKWWEDSPNDGSTEYKHWHAYRLENMSAGYFIANLLDAVSGNAISRNSRFWFPEGGKEFEVKATKRAIF